MYTTDTTAVATTDILEEFVKKTAPHGPSRNFLAVCVDRLPVMLTTTSINIDLIDMEPTSPLPSITNGPEDEYNGNAEPVLEEGFHIEIPNGIVELLVRRNSH